jgi:hypothetical protein
VREAFSGTLPQLLNIFREQKVQSLEKLCPEQTPSNDMPLLIFFPSKWGGALSKLGNNMKTVLQMIFVAGMWL